MKEGCVYNGQEKQNNRTKNQQEKKLDTFNSKFRKVKKRTNLERI